MREEPIGHEWIPPTKGQWRGALMLCLIMASILHKNRVSIDLRHHKPMTSLWWCAHKIAESTQWWYNPLQHWTKTWAYLMGLLKIITLWILKFHWSLLWLVLIMARCRTGYKQLSKPMMTSFTNACMPYFIRLRLVKTHWWLLFVSLHIKYLATDIALIWHH